MYVCIYINMYFPHLVCKYIYGHDDQRGVAQKVGCSLVVHCILWGGQRGVAVSYACSMLFV